MHTSATVLGAILAGGASRRFGAPKANATLCGRTLAERVRDSMAAALPTVVLVANEPEQLRYLGLPIRGDQVPGRGPLAGIHAALHWAAEQGRTGALCVSCDMPFVTAALLNAVLGHAEQTGAAVVMPASNGRRGREPLCAFYSVACLPHLELRLRRGPHQLYSLLDECGGSLLPPERVAELGDPDRLFFNVNTHEDLQRATRWATSPAERACGCAHPSETRLTAHG